VYEVATSGLIKTEAVEAVSFCKEGVPRAQKKEEKSKLEAEGSQ
jgi:hypothetical protein